MSGPMTDAPMRCAATVPNYRWKRVLMSLLPGIAGSCTTLFALPYWPTTPPQLGLVLSPLGVSVIKAIQSWYDADKVST
jgi:hypothetical protein